MKKTLSTVFKKAEKIRKNCLTLPITFARYTADGRVAKRQSKIAWQLSAGAIHGISAATSHGKTTMLDNICLWAVLNTERPVLYFSQEEGEFSIVHNLARISGANVDKLTDEIEKNKKSAEEQLDMLPIAQAYASGRFDIFPPQANAACVKSIVEEFANKYPNNPPVVLLDYMQVFANVSNVEEMAYVANTFRTMAIETNSIVIAASQLQRGANFASFSNDAIADSVNITRSYNTHVLMFSDERLSELVDKDVTKANKKIEEFEQRKNADINFAKFGKPNESDEYTHIYLKMVKNRYGISGGEACIEVDHERGLYLDGIEGKVEQVARSTEEPKPTSKRGRKPKIVGNIYNERARVPISRIHTIKN